MSLSLGLSNQLWGITIPFDCNGKVLLQTAIDLALPGTTYTLSGTCSGPLVINRGNLTLQSQSDANTQLTITNNVTIGLTIVSGSHMVAFSGTVKTAFTWKKLPS